MFKEHEGQPAPPGIYLMLVDGVTEDDKRFAEDATHDGYEQMKQKMETNTMPERVSLRSLHRAFADACVNEYLKHKDDKDTNNGAPVKTQSQGGLKKPECARKASDAYEICISEAK